ncbi:hypothetical protein WISP_00023 [Willisornis vidua]|uniref:Uncharacterized protein n=1 Tax=Willisornis vidua TaxID=1566151 RepID=A0ABQ9CJJ5_9PASS|nr:hypothetical protein WISP_00023 [Willisornis vidua]
MELERLGWSGVDWDTRIHWSMTRTLQDENQGNRDDTGRNWNHIETDWGQTGNLLGVTVSMLGAAQTMVGAIGICWGNWNHAGLKVTGIILGATGTTLAVTGSG